MPFHAISQLRHVLPAECLKARKIQTLSFLKRWWDLLPNTFAPKDQNEGAAQHAVYKTTTAITDLTAGCTCWHSLECATDRNSFHLPSQSFWIILNHSESFWIILNHSESFWIILTNPLQVQWYQVISSASGQQSRTGANHFTPEKYAQAARMPYTTKPATRTLDINGLVCIASTEKDVQY